MSKPPIHCLLDCLALAVRTETDFDDRPAYIGVWNAPFIADENGFAYYSETLDPDTELLQFESMYGKGIIRWNEASGSKEDNFRRLERECEGTERFRTVITLVDLYYMPYSAICYKLKHLPHIVNVLRRDDGNWFVKDPFFEWEGEVPNSVLFEALTCERLSAGVTVDGLMLREPEPENIARMFREQFSMEASQLVTVVDAYLRHIADGTPGYSVETLFATIGQVGIVAKRWKGFGLVAEFFADQGGGDSKELLLALEQLMIKWENFVLTVVRLGVLGKHEKLPDARFKLSQIAELEYEVKRRLWGLFGNWEVTRIESIV